MKPKLITRNAILRSGTLLLVLVVFFCYMCACPQPGERTLTLPAISSEALRQHVETLAGEIGERSVFRPGSLARAADYIEQVWRAQGYAVNRQDCGNGCQNLEAVSPGNSEIIIVGAHYDSVAGSPGANDNASAVAAMLELSRACAGQPTKRTVRFVAFANEEPPFFKTPLQGSRSYARACRQRRDDIRVMISLETIGYYDDRPGSQRYPFPFGLFYPNRGNFLAFISNFKSRGLMHEAVRVFRAHCDFPVECCATFAAVPGVDWSDHGSFWQEGYRAFMVTDTAPYRYPHYHMPSDTPDKVCYEALARVTAG
ncbi:MAG: M28 family peptidase, partial [Verrucomicrobiae bacterium]|nr:M28 family peptidase [Verrucomicrobiae bacterium]